MVTIGNFFFRYRNYLFVLLYLLLFVPSPELFTRAVWGEYYYLIPLVSGLLVTFSGELLRGLTIGLAYIIRGGKDRRIYAEQLVTEGIFNHCRNPLYVGNILMLLGAGILANSLLYVAGVMPVFLFIYQAIVLAEEHFLRNKFGSEFDAYARRVGRWRIRFRGLPETLRSMEFRYRRWLLKEYNTLFVWLAGIAALIGYRYPQLFEEEQVRNLVFAGFGVLLCATYLYVRFQKKTGRWIGG